MSTPEQERLPTDSVLTETNRLMAEVEQKIEWAFSLANDPDWQQNARSTLRLYSRWPLNFVDAQDVQSGRISDYGRRTLPQLIRFAIDDAREQVPGFDFSLGCFEAWASTKAGEHFKTYANKYEQGPQTTQQNDTAIGSATDAPVAGSLEQFAAVVEANPVLKQKLESMHPVWAGDYGYLVEILNEYGNLIAQKKGGRGNGKSLVGDLAHHLAKKGWLTDTKTSNGLKLIKSAFLKLYGLEEGKAGNDLHLYFGKITNSVPNPNTASSFCGIKQNPTANLPHSQ